MLSLQRRIFVDVDGVLADFVGEALAWHGLPRNTLITQYNLWDQLGMSQEDFWREIDRESFWSDLKPTPESGAVLLAADRFAPGGVCLVTEPRPVPCSYAGKFRWLRHHCQHLPHLIGPSRNFAAGPGRVLIDDSDSNIDRWRLAGGNGILFPRTWNGNRAYAGDPVDYLRTMLRRVEMRSAMVDD